MKRNLLSYHFDTEDNQIGWTINFDNIRNTGSAEDIKRSLKSLEKMISDHCQESTATDKE